MILCDGTPQVDGVDRLQRTGGRMRKESSDENFNPCRIDWLVVRHINPCEEGARLGIGNYIGIRSSSAPSRARKCLHKKSPWLPIMSSHSATLTVQVFISLSVPPDGWSVG